MPLAPPFKVNRLYTLTFNINIHLAIERVISLASLIESKDPGFIYLVPPSIIMPLDSPASRLDIQLPVTVYKPVALTKLLDGPPRPPVSTSSLLPKTMP